MAPGQCLEDDYKSFPLQHLKQIRTTDLNLLSTKVIFLGSNLGIWCIRDFWHDTQLALSPFLRETILP